ncbi:MAG: S8/S53 family peptidase [Actinomycetota bacterium]|nr:S8/S53 family peptidase [Actinomycetota bacterium]
MVKDGSNGENDRLRAECEDVKVGWKDRVRFSSRGGIPVAYRPREIVTDRPDEARSWILGRAGEHENLREEFERIEVVDVGGLGESFGRLKSVPDERALVDEMRKDGFKAQLNHVYFTHCGWCPPHPAMWSSGGLANPAFANPAFANPAFAIRSTGLRRSSARPPTLEEREAELLTARITKAPDPDAPKIIVVDTGLAGSHQPHALTTANGILAAEGADLDQPDSDQNKVLDGAAGHGTFIAGLIRSVTPGCQVTVHRVLRTYGDGDEATIVHCLNELESDENTILNLSFGGYVWEEPALLASAVRRFQSGGGVVVSSAGNDGTCQPSYPAALPDVVSVGAVGPTGPAAFTNYGPWVRACAPGVSLVSMFFEGFEGVGMPGSEGLDPDNFEGWAEWSGTSFAAPVVAASLARMMKLMGCPAKEAVERLIDHPSLMRLPYLGTVVNVI